MKSSTSQPLMKSHPFPLGKGSCEKIAQRQVGCLGRDAVLLVRLGFPIVDARERVPTSEFFHSPREQRPLGLRGMSLCQLGGKESWRTTPAANA